MSSQALSKHIGAPRNSITSLLERGRRVKDRPTVKKRDTKVVFPDTNHPDLVIQDPSQQTSASIILDVITQDVRRATFASREERNEFVALQEAFAHHRMLGTRANPIPEHVWEEYDLAIRALVLEHVRDSLKHDSGSGRRDPVEHALFTGSITEASALSTTARDRSNARMHTMITRWIAEDFFAPKPKPTSGAGSGARTPSPEEREMSNLTLSLLAMTSVPERTERGDGAFLKYDRKLHEVRRTVARIREYINHTYCWFLYNASTQPAKDEYLQIHKEFVQSRAADVARTADVFTGQHLVDHVTRHFLEDNAALHTRVERNLNEMVRYYDEPILDWLDRFTPLVIEYKNTYMGDDIEDINEVDLWKRTFAKNVNGIERSIIRRESEAMIDSDKFTQDDWETIKRYTDGNFDPIRMRLLILNITSEKHFSLTYRPDSAVKAYNAKRFKSLYEDTKFPNYVRPQKASQVPPAKPPPRKRRTAPAFLMEDDGDVDPVINLAIPPAKQPKRGKRGTVPPFLQCDNPVCRRKGTSSNHAKSTYKGTDYPVCHFPAGTKPQQPPRGQKINPTPQRSSEPRRCYNCNAEDHLIRQCPLLQHARQKVRKSPAFHTLFTNAQSTEAWNRIIDANAVKDTHNVCRRCLRIAEDCNGNCSDNKLYLTEAMAVKKAYAQRPDLQSAIADACLSDAVGPMTAESLMAYDGGQEEDARYLESSTHPTVSLDTMEPNQQDLTNFHDSEHLDATDIEDRVDLTEQVDGYGSEEIQNEMYLTIEPAIPGGIEVQSSLYWSMHSTKDGTPLTQKPEVLKADAPRDNRVAKGEATFLIPGKRTPTFQKRTVFLDSCGSYPLFEETELHEIRDCSEYGMPPLRFSTLETKTSWYRKVGKACLLLPNGKRKPLLAYAYSRSKIPKGSNATDIEPDAAFYLFDMSTLLDLGIDIAYHMSESREGRIQPLKRKDKNNGKPSQPRERSRPFYTKEARHGTREPMRLKEKPKPTRGITGGVTNAAKTAANLAKRHLTLWRRPSKGEARTPLLATTTPLPDTSSAASEHSISGHCTCPIRVAETLSAEEYNLLQADLKRPTVGGTTAPALPAIAEGEQSSQQ